ncbi:MAG: glycosyltransferase family 4 protein [Poseidonia sp.]
MALEGEGARPRLLIVRGSFSTMGGAERELLQLIRMSHGRWDVHLATLDISSEAIELMQPAKPVLIKPSAPLVWPEGAFAEVTAAASKAAEKAWAALDIPWEQFDVVHLSVCRGTLEILPLIPPHLPVNYHCLEPPRWLYEDVLHRHPNGRPKRPLWLTKLVFTRQRRRDKGFVRLLLRRPKSAMFGNSPWSQILLERTYGLPSDPTATNGHPPRRNAAGRPLEGSHVLPTVDLSNWPAEATPQEITERGDVALPDGPYVVTIGTVSYVKGTYDTLRSLVNTPYALVQAGGGSAEEKAALVAEGQRLGVEVVCMPRLSQAALVGVVRGAHAMVSHAHHEPFGFTPLEAMAVGVPPIMVNEGGFHYTMRDAGAGVLVERGDHEGWMAAYQAAANPETRKAWAVAGRKHVASNYPPESQLEAIERIMAPILNQD